MTNAQDHSTDLGKIFTHCGTELRFLVWDQYGHFHLLCPTRNEGGRHVTYKGEPSPPVPASRENGTKIES
jgi:hypothetical protein